MVTVWGGTDQQKAVGSPEVGETDTKKPFQSVKAAVSLFGEVAIKGKPAVRRSRLSSENVLDKETQIVLARRDVDKFKREGETAITTQARAEYSELEKAERTLNDLTTKLKAVDETKKLAIETAEAVKEKAKKLEAAKSQQLMENAARELELDEARQQYEMTACELDAAKEQINKIRQDFDAALEAKSSSFKQAAEAQRSAKTNKERASDLSQEIGAMQESAQQLKIASAQIQEQQAKVVAEKDARIHVCKTALAEAEKNLEILKKEYDPEITKNLQAKLAETSAEIELLQEEMKKGHALEMERMRALTIEFNEATKALQEIAIEESSLRNMVTFLRMESENVKMEKTELLVKEIEKEYAALEKETENARREAEEMKNNAEELKEEAKNARLLAQDAEGELELALKEVEEAKAAEKKAREEMKTLSERKSIEDLDADNEIKISLGEFESLKKKVEESGNIADTTVTDVMAQVEAMNASNNEVEKKLGGNLKAIEEIKEATSMALRSAEMSEAAQKTLKAQLQRWREEEQTVLVVA
ncbi:WEB family protein [Populus alba x Populus x berolinensis]|uniref:WEB family protein n=1 Tax=Populus alba x Populus x berolinensis TaxID=444605 RepID=A0AAD6QK46_9ROSI|nr:WEB family protein [Populus alba x Populus x berolinensis]